MKIIARPNDQYAIKDSQCVQCGVTVIILMSLNSGRVVGVGL